MLDFKSQRYKENKQMNKLIKSVMMMAFAGAMLCIVGCGASDEEKAAKDAADSYNSAVKDAADSLNSAAKNASDLMDKLNK